MGKNKDFTMEQTEKDAIGKEKEKNKKLKWIVVIWVLIAICILSCLIWIYHEGKSCIDKPIIYIYPEEELNVTITVSNPENLTTTYPKYDKNWSVIAKPNGDLTDIKTGRSLYSIYWEGKRKIEPSFKDGFVVKGENVASFLEEKLEILGLNEREAEEFIIYWLPKMEGNTYNLIHFETKEEIDDNMKLNIYPEPETLIRVSMDFKAMSEWKEIPEQKLQRVTRQGYTVVEWGGTEVR